MQKKGQKNTANFQLRKRLWRLENATIWLQLKNMVKCIIQIYIFRAYVHCCAYMLKVMSNLKMQIHCLTMNQV